MNTLSVEPAYLCVPKVSSYGYLKAELVNNASYPLLAGPAQLFIGDGFTGSSALEEIASKEEFSLAFGLDEGIKTKREEVKRHKEAGFMGKNRMTYRYRMEVANYKPHLQTVMVMDQLPLAADEEIKVTMGEVSPAPQVNKDTGEVSWNITLKPQEKKEIIFEFTVEYPKEREVVGL
jgi:uncharacterized protein (TIGR02231 family)